MKYRGSLPGNKKEKGFSILEGLMAILIFSLGILAVIGLQAASVRAVTDSRYRVEATFLANKLISEMWVNYDRNAVVPSLRASVQPGGAFYDTWLAEVEAALPGAQSNPPVLTIVAGNDNSSIVTVQLFWKAPSETNVHNYTLNTQIR